MLRDIKYAFRRLRRNPGFTLTGVLVLALGFGVNTAICGIVYAVLLRPLPYPRPEQLVVLFERDVVGEQPRNPVSSRNFLDWQEQARSFQGMAATAARSFNLSGTGSTGEPDWVEGSACTHNLFSVLRVEPALGRSFSPEDDQPGASATVVISNGLWQQRFGRSAAVIGQQIRLDKVPHVIIGVMPSGFEYPRRTVQVWVPLRQAFDAKRLDSRGYHFLQVVGRLKAGRTLDEARAEVDGISRRIRQAYPNVLTGKGATIVPLRDALVYRVRASLFVLIGVALCVLLIACLNLGNVMLARARADQQEMGIRLALGARRQHVMRQFLTETFMLSLGGALGGLLLGYPVMHLFAASNPAVSVFGVQMGSSALLFSAVLTLPVSVIVGAIPSFHYSRFDFVAAIKQGVQSSNTGPSQKRFRYALLGVELGGACLLLMCAGLLLQSFYRLRTVQPGFRPDQVIALGISLPEAAYAGKGRATAFYETLLERTRSLPGVVRAGIVSIVPLQGHVTDATFTIEGHAALPPGQFLDAVDLWVDPEYFRTMGIPVIRGRTFDRFDRQPTADGSVIISQSMAKQFWPAEDPIGQYIRTRSDGPRYQVVGIVGDVDSWLDKGPEPTMYFPLLAGGPLRAFLVLRTEAGPEYVASAVRHEIHHLDPDQAVYQAITMRQLIARSIADRRSTLLLVGLFALLALVLSSVGLYGVIACFVRERVREIGIRMALGAERTQVLGLILLEGMKPCSVGLVIGGALAVACTRFLRSLLYETSPTDPLTLCAVAGGLLAVAALACLLPALRAAGLDPARALRNE